jgi:hypothetical protein
MSEQVSGSVTLNSRQEESAQAKTWAVALVLILQSRGLDEGSNTFEGESSSGFPPSGSKIAKCAK